jgi:hypothetical protein
MNKNDDGTVVVAVKTAMMPRGTTARLPDSLSAAQAVTEMRRVPPKDAGAMRVLQQLEREMAGPHDFLAVSKGGEVVKIDPHKTTLRELAVPREVQTARGPETVRVAAFEVQAYAPVGN